MPAEPGSFALRRLTAAYAGPADQGIEERSLEMREPPLRYDQVALTSPDSSEPRPARPRLALTVWASAGLRAGFGVAPWLAGLALPLVAVWAWLFPAFPLTLLGLLAAAGLVVWWRPALALAILPAAMPALDLAPWSGRFFLDEFDLLSAVCLALAFARVPATGRPHRGVSALNLAFGLLALSLAISTLRALLPWTPPDANSFSSYDSPYNALRIVKGAVWAWLFVGLYRRVQARGEGAASLFGKGMAIGLLLTVAWILWERITFVGLFDFASVYRVSGPFSAMHKGGAYVECYLAAASAFVVVPLLHRWRRAVLIPAALLLAGAAYAVAVTYSRNGYAAMAVMLVVALAGGLRWRGASWRDLAIGLAALLVVVGAAAPIVVGPYARARLSHSTHDFEVRRAHWADALAMRHDGWATSWFGEGIGRFPDLHYWRSREPVHAASYGLKRESGRDFLRLGPGATLYVEQIVDPPPGADVVLSAELRAPVGPAALTVALCEKWLLTSRNCSFGEAVANPETGKAGAWQHAEVHLRVPPQAPTPWPFHPLVKLALLTPGEDHTLDVRGLRLQIAGGDNLLANGDFGAGLDRWFFSTDVDPPWHIHSLPVAVLFDQGWFGALAWGWVLGLAVARGVRFARAGRAESAAALAALGAFLFSGSLNTLIDAPRFLWLLLLLLWLAADGEPAQARDAAGRGLAG